MPFERGTLQYGVGEANAVNAHVNWTMIERAYLGGKMTDAQLVDFEKMVAGGLQPGICFALSNRWAADFLYSDRVLNGMAKAPYGVVSSVALQKAYEMQSEHMTRVRKRVAQDKLGMSVTDIERKAMRKYALLEQTAVFTRREIRSEAQKHDAAVDIVMAMRDSRPLRLGLTFSGGGHELGLVQQGSHFYIFDPNYGLYRYDRVTDFARDLESLLIEQYSEDDTAPTWFSLHELRKKTP